MVLVLPSTEPVMKMNKRSSNVTAVTAENSRVRCSKTKSAQYVTICHQRQMVDKDGIRHPVPLDQLDVQPKHPFYGIGIRQFMDRYDEILDFFKKKKPKQKAEEFEAVRREKTKVFTSKIPVYTTFLRPQSSTADTLYYSSIDRIINPLNRLCEKLRNGSRSDLELDYWLWKVEQRVLELYDLNMGEIETKEGWIRKFILGGSLDSWETLNQPNCGEAA